MGQLEQFRTAFLIWLPLAAGALTLALAAWRWTPWPRCWLAPQPVQPVPWSGGEVYFLFLAYLFLPGLVYNSLQQTPFLDWLPDRVQAAPLGPEPVRTEPSRPAARLQPWAMLLTCPLLVLLMLALPRLASETEPRHLGVTTQRLAANVGLGVLVGVVATCTVNALHVGVGWLLVEGFHMAPEEHGLTQLARQGLSPVEWTALVASAVLAAPVMEELFFRGVLQRWLVSHHWGGDLGVAMAFALAVILRWPTLRTAWLQQGFAGVLPELSSAGFVLATVPAYLVVRYRSASTVPAGIVGSALVFAAVHAPVWPTPIPLFFLGLGLGWLAQRSQSLLAPLVVHAFFNATACLVLVVAG